MMVGFAGTKISRKVSEHMKHEEDRKDLRKKARFDSLSKFSNLHPNGSRVAVEPLEVASETPGGIVIPEGAKDKPQRGLVVAVGNGRICENGGDIPVNFNIGDTVIFGAYSGIDMEVNGSTIKMLGENEVLAKIEV